MDVLRDERSAVPSRGSQPSACADRKYRWCVMSALPLLDRQGRIVKWYGTVVDMHDWKQAQEDLRNTQAELAHMARVMTMGELTASIAHEVNQPLPRSSPVVTVVRRGCRTIRRTSTRLAPQQAGSFRPLHRPSEIVQRLRALFRKTTSMTAPVDMNGGNRRNDFSGPP